MGAGLGSKMLAAAESDLEPGLPCLLVRELAREGAARNRADRGQKTLDQLVLAGAKLLAFPAPEEGAGPFGGFAHRTHAPEDITIWFIGIRRLDRIIH